MPKIRKIDVAPGVGWIEVPEAQLYMLCGSPADSVKLLMKRGLIVPTEQAGVTFETGPNSILLSDVIIQNGSFSNIAEFPVLQMLYRQGMMIPGHPGNTGFRPLLIGSQEQVNLQLHYIHRGNYGLISQDEITSTGVPPAAALEMMRMKLKFDFGRIRDTKDLLDIRIVRTEPVEIMNGVTVRRLRLNGFEIRYRDERVEMDLNLKPDEKYGIPYTLNYHDINREYFAVIHSGEGDGWDVNRPAMASILMFQGKIYLIDAEPNVQGALKALGIGINEIEGIFHTHAHDDHFGGLPTLLRADRRIKYFATPLVRSSVMKKLAALLSVEERNFSQFFEFHDLAFDVWHDIGGLEVKPLFSPHPVETNTFIFRALWGDGYRTYAHLADIVSLEVLKGMITSDAGEYGISAEFFEKVKGEYLSRENLKKIDIGGGLIHGSAEDFRGDESDKIVLAHTALELTDRQKEIGSGAPFGTVDVLIPATQDLSAQFAMDFLRAYLPSVPVHDVKILLNNPIESLNPESILIKKGECNRDIYLVLSGTVEQIHAARSVHNILSAGALVGENSGLHGEPASETYRAGSFVRAMRIPRELYLAVVKKNNLYDRIRRLQEMREFLRGTWLFGEALSQATQNRIAGAMDLRRFDREVEISEADLSSLHLVRSGSVERLLGSECYEILGPMSFFAEEHSVFDTPSIFRFRTVESTEIFLIPASVISGIPVVRWKLLETFEKRLSAILSSAGGGRLFFHWRDEYSVGNQEIDRHHMRLFTMAHKLSEALESGHPQEAIEYALDFLIRYSEYHFSEEEKLMQQHGFPGLEEHAARHGNLLQQVEKLRERIIGGGGDDGLAAEVIEFFKGSVVNHVLTDDRKYIPYLGTPLK